MEMKVLKRTKMAEEGMDCHMRNPRNRFLTIISSGVADIVFFFASFGFLILVLVLDFVLQTRVCV